MEGLIQRQAFPSVMGISTSAYAHDGGATPKIADNRQKSKEVTRNDKRNQKHVTA